MREGDIGYISLYVIFFRQAGSRVQKKTKRKREGERERAESHNIKGEPYG